jgi:hypothetical protein
VLELGWNRMGRRGIPADGAVLGLSLVRKKKGKGRERERLRSGFYRVAQCGRGGERVGAWPATDRRRRRHAPWVPSAAWEPRHRQHNVVGRGRASRGGASGGRASQGPRGVEKSGAGSTSSWEDGRQRWSHGREQKQNRGGSGGGRQD